MKVASGLLILRLLSVQIRAAVDFVVLVTHGRTEQTAVIASSTLLPDAGRGGQCCAASPWTSPSPSR